MCKMETDLIKEAQMVLQNLRRQIPSTLYSIEKQMFIGNELIKRIPENHKIVLRRLVEYFLLRMREMEASDIDMGGPGAQNMIWLRIHGEKNPVPEFGAYEIEESDLLIQNLLTDGYRFMLYDRRSLDFSYVNQTRNGHSALRYRANVHFEMEALSLNMRAIGSSIRPYRSYGLHPNVTRTLSLSHTREGMVLVTGITGSGKTSTMDAIVDLNNRIVNGHIIIIASPVEYIHHSNKCIIRHREVGTDTLSFKDGTVEALRQDPDIIVIGEMRDSETILGALEVAGSGHKVISTLHTSSTVESIERIIGEVPPMEQERVRMRLADILKCVISQKLVPSIDGRRILAKEIMVMIPSIKSAIKSNNTEEIYQMISERHNYGMMTMEQDLNRLLAEGKISKQTAFSFANNKRRMQQLMSQQTL